MENIKFDKSCQDSLSQATEYSLMKMSFNPSKNSPPNVFIKTLEMRYKNYYNNFKPTVGFIVH